MVWAVLLHHQLVSQVTWPLCVCRCLEFDEQPPVEYSKQLVLSCVLHCCQKLSHEATSVDAVVKQALNVESVVQCIRASQNPHTHHHALLLLAHVAGIMPVSVCLSGGISSRILSHTVLCPLYDGLPQHCALLHSRVHWSVLYPQSDQSVNFTYWIAAIWLYDGVLCV
jgi:hypothetical protein